MSAKKDLAPFSGLSLVHTGIASVVLLKMIFNYGLTHIFHFLVFAILALLFIVAQYAAFRLAKQHRLTTAIWIVICALIVCISAIPILVHDALISCMFFLAAIPLFVAVTDQWKQLPTVLFLTFVASAATILMDLVLSGSRIRLVVDSRQLWIIVGIGFLVYLGCQVIISYAHYRNRSPKTRFQINVATQYALVITGISAMVIILVTGVLMTQIRSAQINQVGENFQTIAENFAKLVGSHLEQQTQKLQLLTQQVPIFKENLTQANTLYLGDRKSAQVFLNDKNRLWSGPAQDDAFVMGYLNNPIIRALSRFRGHNSFHNDIVLVDGYGGLVASLGRKPDRFYFYDHNWWKITWNQGLGNVFIGDLQEDEQTAVPKLRIAVDIIDHSTNEVIGMLSSNYLLRTLLEDIIRFKPDTVDQISLTDSNGRVIASTTAEIRNQTIWPQLSKMVETKEQSDSGWALGRDHLDQAALIGYSTLSTAYNVISDPLHRLGWHIVVSGTRSNTLAGVTQSTKLALLVGLVAMAIGVLGAMAAARVITRPIDNLTATASAMSEGDLEIRAHLAGPEELVALSAGFNRLTDRLHEVILNLKNQTTQLVQAKGEAEAATKLKGEFLANMSHEIRTPLNAILGFADILASSIEDVKQRRHAETIKSSGTDLLQLINDILDLSKIEAGRMEIHTSSIDLRHLFKELQRIFSISAEEKKIGIEMIVSPEVPYFLMLDRVRLRQVLFNLIGNAVKFTDQGQVRCHASTTPARQKDQWHLLIEVRDTGIGIDPGAHTKIFETFNQHHGQPSSSIEGTGLGLTITKSLIEMMGGRIEVKGAPEKGSLFTVYIPRVKAVDAEISEAEAAIMDETGAKRIVFESARILIADDMEVNRNLIVEALKTSPMKFDQAADGRAAVALAKEKRFDLILMDIRMPHMDGYAALKQIRQNHRWPRIPIIATTAAAMKEDIARIRNAGFDDFLIRPFDQDALLNLLSRYLSHDDLSETHPSEVTGFRLSVFDARMQAPWSCPPEAENYLETTLIHRWQQVLRKQSIPDIIAFAEETQAAGARYQIDLLSHYGSQLADYAEAFDIHHVERLLRIFEDLLDSRIKASN